MIWGIALVAVALARERPRVALAVALVMALAPLTSETLKPLLAHPHVQLGTPTSAPPPGRAGTRPPRSRSCCARCSSRPSACARGGGGRRPRTRWPSAGAADPRLAHAERRVRRLPAGGAVDGAGRGRAARGRSALAARAAPAQQRSRIAAASAAPCAPGSHSGSDSPAGPSRVGGAAEDEQQVREPVQVAHDLGVAVLADGDRAPLGAAADGAADVQLRRRAACRRGSRTSAAARASR